MEQIKELNQKLSDMRHDVNNFLSLITAAAELARHKPDTADRMMATLTLQPPKISEAISSFSAQFEKAFGITRK